MAVNWLLGQQQGPDPGQRFQQAFEHGRETQYQNELRGFQQDDREEQRAARQAQQQQQLTERQREELRLGARIVREINPQDDAGWQRARAAAGQMGIDVSQVPPTFDPNYRDQLLAAGRALEPQSSEPGFTLGEGQVRYDASGNPIARGAPRRPHYIPLAPGGRLVLDPSTGGQQPEAAPPPQPGTVQEGYRFRGGNPADPNAWEPVQGGAASTAPRNFP